MQRFKNKFTEPLNNILYSKEIISANKLQETFDQDLALLKKKNQKIVFTDFLIEILEKNNTQETLNETNYLTVLDTFGILKFWEKQVISSSVGKRQNALRILDDLKIGISGSSILRSVYHKNNDLRKQARATLVEYDNNDPYKFLEESFDNDFNALDEIRVHYFLSNKAKEEKLPQLFRWVKSSNNNNFKTFIIKEIGYFNQKDCAPLLLQLLGEEKDQQVICEIIETLGLLKYTIIEDQLNEMYEMASKPVQKSIIKAMTNFKTPKTLNALELNYQHTHDNDIKLQLAHAMIQFGNSGRKKINALSKSSSAFDKQIFAQVNYQA